MVTVRLARLPDDYGQIAAVLCDEQGDAEGDESTTPEELRDEDDAREPGRPWARFVAFMGERMVGAAVVEPDSIHYRADVFKFDLRVRQDDQGKGAGKALYAAVLDFVAPYRPRELNTLVWWVLPRPQRFLWDRGFVERHRRIDQVLDLAQFDDAHFAALADENNADEIVIRTYAELAADPDRNARLHALDVALWEDVPVGETLSVTPMVPRSLAQFEREELLRPDFMPDAWFIAVRRADGAYIGYTSHRPFDGGLNVEMTGVLPAFRRRGLATRLKLYGIRYAREHGLAQLTTVNDAPNVAMLSLNRRFGFTVNGQLIRFVKVFSTESTA